MNEEAFQSLSMNRVRKSLAIKPALEDSSWRRCRVADGGVLLTSAHNHFASSAYRACLIPRLTLPLCHESRRN